MHDIKNFLNNWFECKIIDSDMLPADMRIDRESDQWPMKYYRKQRFTWKHLEGVLLERRKYCLNGQEGHPAFVNCR
jgi:hypothetical protein